MCSKENEFKSILFALCYFHAVVAERRKFGAQGWNRSYPFNNGDLTISINVLYNYLEANPKVSGVPRDRTPAIGAVTSPFVKNSSVCCTNARASSSPSSPGSCTLWQGKEQGLGAMEAGGQWVLSTRPGQAPALAPASAIAALVALFNDFPPKRQSLCRNGGAVRVEASPCRECPSLTDLVGVSPNTDRVREGSKRRWQHPQPDVVTAVDEHQAT